MLTAIAPGSASATHQSPRNVKSLKVPSKKPLASQAATRRVGAGLCILGIMITWIIMAEVVQGMEDTFPKPYFLRLCVNGFYSLCLVIWAIWRFIPLKGGLRMQGVPVEPVSRSGASDVRHDHFEIDPSSARDFAGSRGMQDSYDGKSDGKVKSSQLHQMKEEPFKRFNFLGYYNWCYFFGASIILGVTSFGAGWFWYLSLPITSVSANTAICQSMCMMVYVFSIFLLKEPVTCCKTTAVFIAVLGVFMVSFFGSSRHPTKSASIAHTAHPSLHSTAASIRLLLETNRTAFPHNGHPFDVFAKGRSGRLLHSEVATNSDAKPVPLPSKGLGPGRSEPVEDSAKIGRVDQGQVFLGYLFCVCSMVLYALFEVLYKKWASHSADPVPLMNSLRFLGLVGASTVIFCSPLLLILDLCGLETFQVPNFSEIKLIAVVGVLDTFFNSFLLLAIMLSSPLFASVGCLLVLPASLLWDKLVHHYAMPFWALFGVGLIIVGFVVFVADEYTRTLSPAAKASPLYDYEILGGIHEEVDKTSIEVDIAPPARLILAPAVQPDIIGRETKVDLVEDDNVRVDKGNSLYEWGE